ncbi:T9SS type A sorting domain-containing protein [Algibacter miyuki]|uniref:T9SS type A sorting domain-containing protein n=1 Tax=Algibacter miyuki TaxID=1306933 RepID=A0ABV5H2S2_9FLAO|nr:T9SS type A sorting domain-containing protein [Algibacter miyuki]MDN3663885.1 T9SS type A sorting domain-containing protein [Algibacter miyuki]
MKRTLFLTCLIVLTFAFEASALRSMYVNGFASILGDETAENNLLSYAQTNGIEKLLLYDLHIVNSSHNLSNVSSNQILADFISKAKTNYGVLSVGAVAENAWFFTNVINTYNNSRTNATDKFDVYNLEFEYWGDSAVGPGGYYCNTYLGSTEYPCSNDGAFKFVLSILDDMRSLAHNNSHPITTEAYLGWPTTAQAEELGDHLDELLLHAYVANPNTSFSYAKDRLIDFANGTPGLDVSIIFSSEPNFMQNWLLSNSMSAAEDIFTIDWMNASSAWTNNINLTGFTYFAYSFNENVTLSTGVQDVANNVMVYPNPVKNTLYIENLNNVKSIMVYNNMGQLLMETKAEEIDFTQFNKGLYFLKMDTDKGVETKKILKN